MYIVTTFEYTAPVLKAPTSSDDRSSGRLGNQRDQLLQAYGMHGLWRAASGIHVHKVPSRVLNEARILEKNHQGNCGGVCEP